MKIVKIRYVFDNLDRKNIKKQMLDKDLTLRKVAEIMGVSIAYVSAVLAGQRTITPRIIMQFEKCGLKIDLPKAKENLKDAKN